MTAIDKKGRRTPPPPPPPTQILGYFTVRYRVRYFVTLLIMKCGQNTAFYANDEFMPNWRRHRRPLFAVLALCDFWGLIKADINPNDTFRPISIFTTHFLDQIFKKLPWSLNYPNVAIHLIEWHHICRIMTSYHCWLLLVAVDIIRDKLPQVTEPFVCIAPRAAFS